jgi:hypothetical protein
MTNNGEGEQMNLDMTQNRWTTVLSRWSDVPECGEKRLMVALLAMAITEESRAERDFEHGFFTRGGGFDTYCKVIGLNPQFVREQIDRAAQKVAA